MSLARFKPKLRLSDRRDADTHMVPPMAGPCRDATSAWSRYEQALLMPGLRSDRKDAVRIPGMLVLVPANDGDQFSCGVDRCRVGQ